MGGHRGVPGVAGLDATLSLIRGLLVHSLAA